MSPTALLGVARHVVGHDGASSSRTIHVQAQEHHARVVPNDGPGVLAGSVSGGDASEAAAASDGSVTYCERGAARWAGAGSQSLPVCAYECVDARATEAATRIVEQMLLHCPAAVIGRMATAGCSIAVIGRRQVTSDMPPHRFLRGVKASLGQRTYDDGCRGVGGTKRVPCTSVGEENLLGNDPHFPRESILVHEFAHTVMNVGVSGADRAAIRRAYELACKTGEFDLKSYMMATAEEFWAEGAQAWFHASVRTDVNCGITTREGVRQQLPLLAAVLQKTFGDGEWRYDSENCHGWAVK